MMTMDSNKVFETERLTVTISPAKLEDHVRILDIGGGGEGVISKIYKHKVVAIDQRYDELSEILDTESLKLVMDATKLDFIQEQFERATAFYSYMYMSEAEVKSSISEVYRVLKDKGLLLRCLLAITKRKRFSSLNLRLNTMRRSSPRAIVFD